MGRRAVSCLGAIVVVVIVVAAVAVLVWWIGFNSTT